MDKTVCIADLNFEKGSLICIKERLIAVQLRLRGFIELLKNEMFYCRS